MMMMMMMSYMNPLKRRRKTLNFFYRVETLMNQIMKMQEEREIKHMHLEEELWEIEEKRYQIIEQSNI